MALPTLSKTWIFKVNQHLPAQSDAPTTWKYIYMNIKQALTTASGWTDAAGASTTNSYPWTVTSSSNGTVGTASLGDNWLSDIANVNTSSGSGFSWIVLRQAQVNSLFEICFGITAGVNYSLGNLFVTHTSGFATTGLLTTAFPTTGATYNTLVNNQSFDTVGNSAHDLTLHYMMSTDGECTYIFGCYSNSCVWCWLLGKAKSPVSGWTVTSIASSCGGGGNSPTYANFLTYAYITARPTGGTSLMYLYGTTEGYNSSTVGQLLQVRNQITGEWAVCPIGLVSNTPGYSGRHGELYDLWFVSDVLKLGETMGTGSPATRQFAVFPNLLVPWNRSDVLTE